MSPLDRPVPPAGEELHIPGGSIQPFLLAVFITVALVGVTQAWWITAAGGVGVFFVIVAWVRGARRELSELPLHDEPH
jgi:hypothetical protein